MKNISTAVCAIALGAMATAPVYAEVAFTNVTTPALADAIGSGRGLAWVDYTGNGYPDIYQTNWIKGPNRLFRNEGGVFVEVLGTPLSDEGFGGIAIWADIDNDGDLDLYLVNSGNNRLFRNDGDDVFVEITTPELANGLLSRSASWGDFNNDGHVDLYITVRGINRLFRNLGGGIFDTVNDVVLNNGGVGRGISWVDLNQDGFPDMYFANGGPPNTVGGSTITHPNVLALNNGDNTFTNITPEDLLLPGDSRSVTWVDYDNDGDFDLFITEVNGGVNRLFENQDGVFVEVTTPELAAGGSTRDVAWGDFNNNGYQDLYLSRQFGNMLLRNNGDGTFTDVTVGDLGNSFNGRAVAWADYDNDGDLDLFVVNSELNLLLRNDLDNGNNWLKVKLIGTITNRAAIGAQIRVFANDMQQLRQVGGGHGYMSQPPLTQHFGLAQTEVIDKVEVWWPTSGIVQVLTDVEVNQTLVIEEGIDPGSVDLNGDGVVDGVDLAILLSQWGTSNPLGDINGDGVVDGGDLALLLSNWGALAR